MASLSDIDVTSILWSYATIQHYDAALMASLAGRVADLEDRLDAAVSRIMFAWVLFEGWFTFDLIILLIGGPYPNLHSYNTHTNYC